MPEVVTSEAVERLIRIAFNKENPSDLLMQLVKVLGKSGLKDEASRVKSMSKDIQRAWSNRDKAAALLRAALTPRSPMPTTSERIAKLAADVRTMQASLDKRAFDPPKKFQLRTSVVFRDYRSLGSESIERVRAMVEGTKVLNEALTNMDKYLFGGLGSAGELPARAVNQVRSFTRKTKALTSQDVKEMLDLASAEAHARLQQRLDQVRAEAQKYR